MWQDKIERAKRVLPLLIVATIIFDIITIQSVEPVPVPTQLLWLFLYFSVTFTIISTIYFTYSYLNSVAQLDR